MNFRHLHGSELNECLMFRSKYVQFPIICSLQYSLNINTVEVHPHSDLLHICIIVKPKNRTVCSTNVTTHYTLPNHLTNIAQL